MRRSLVMRWCLDSACLAARLQEILTDPSYRGQFVAFTHVHIGNVGINFGEALNPDHSRTIAK